MLGGALLRLGRYGEAERAGARAVEIDPGSGEAHAVLGEALFITGRLAEAFESYRRADRIRKGPDRPRRGLLGI